MAYSTEDAFNRYFTTINLPGDHRATANNRASWVAQRLRNRGLTVLDAFPMGSIPRYTALEEYSDLDVMTVLHFSQHLKDRKPSNVLLTVRSALGDGAQGVRRNGQAVTMKFASWPNVDVVPASRLTDSNNKFTGHYRIPDMVNEEWIDTNPGKHSGEIGTAAGVRGEKYRRVIKMLKDWNRRQQASMQSYHLEVISLKLSCEWKDHSWPLYQWFQNASGYVDFCWYDNKDVASYLSFDQRTRIKTSLSEATATSLSAWHAYYQNDHQTAITTWKRVFGQRFPSYG